jgi:hypothetical protein
MNIVLAARPWPIDIFLLKRSKCDVFSTIISARESSGMSHSVLSSHLQEIKDISEGKGD